MNGSIRPIRYFLVVFLLVAIAMPVLGVYSTHAMSPILSNEDPYPPPSTPGAPSGYPRLYLSVVFGEPTWDGFEDFSYYIASSSNLYYLGRRRAQALNRVGYGHMSLAIMDFGCASGENSVESWEYEGENHKILSIETIKTRVKEYINGFSNNIHSDSISLTVAVGINASVIPSAAHGTNWANMIDDLNDWVVAHHFENSVYVIGAIDIETQWNPTPQQIQPWINAYDAPTIHRAYNFGNALDCPRDLPPTYPQSQSPVNRFCRDYWYQDDVADVSGNHYMFPLPEIYHIDGRDSDTWYRIGLYHFFDTGYKMNFHGSLTQYFACLQKGWCNGADLYPITGYDQLYNKLNDPYNRVTRSMYYKTDILWYEDGYYQCLYNYDPYPECTPNCKYACLDE